MSQVKTQPEYRKHPPTHTQKKRIQARYRQTKVYLSLQFKICEVLLFCFEMIKIHFQHNLLRGSLLKHYLLRSVVMQTDQDQDIMSTK
jgi:hypothetical protein